jgi:hypothetical protein
MVDATAEQWDEVSRKIHNPTHYTRGGIEAIDVIEAWRLNYHTGNVIKYLCRAGVKNKSEHIQDLQKARWYLDREIKRLSKPSEKIDR